MAHQFNIAILLQCRRCTPLFKNLLEMIRYLTEAYMCTFMLVINSDKVNIHLQLL